MSPYEKPYYSASELRTKYAYVFSTIAEIYKYYHRGEKVGMRFEEVVKLVNQLKEEERLTEYLYESLEDLFKQYPTLLPGEVQKGYETNESKETEHLNRLGGLLSLVQSDLSLELHDLLKEEKERYVKKYL